MKKIVFLLGFGLVLGLGNVNAQCKKSVAAQMQVLKRKYANNLAKFLSKEKLLMLQLVQ